MLKITNNAVGKLSTAMATNTLSVTLEPGQGVKFPSLDAGDYFPVTVTKAASPTEFEIMRCTARTDDVLTVERGQEGTAALSFSPGDIVELRITGGVLAEAFPQMVGSNKGARRVEIDVSGISQTRTLTMPDTDVELGTPLDGTVSTDKLQDGVLPATPAGRAKMADGFTTAEKLATDAVTREKIINDAINAAKIDEADKQAIRDKLGLPDTSVVDIWHTGNLTFEVVGGDTLNITTEI